MDNNTKKVEKQERKRLSTEEINECVRIYQDPTYTNTPEYNDACLKIYNELEKFLIYILRNRYPTYLETYAEDLLQNCWVGVFQCLKTYDPTKAKLSTWVKPWVEHAAQDWINKETQSSTYYNKNQKRIQDFEKSCLMTGEEYTDYDISEATGISLKTIKACKDRFQPTCSLEAFDENIPEDKITPEQDFIQKEEWNDLQKALKILPKEQEEIIRLRFGFEGSCMSPLKISEYLDIKKEVVIRSLNTAKNTLRNYFKRERLYEDRKTRQDIDVYKEAICYIPMNTEDTDKEMEVFLNSLNDPENASLDDVLNLF